MRKAGKVWGETTLIHANGVLEYHRIEVKAGGRCSKHKHEFKWNGFFVETGKLRIKVYQNDYDLVDVTDLGPGDFMQVKPGVFHSFEALEDTLAFELYWAEFSHDDIIRESVGTAAPEGYSPGVISWDDDSSKGDKLTLDLERKCPKCGENLVQMLDDVVLCSSTLCDYNELSPDFDLPEPYQDPIKKV